jgi:hypothetical protein
MKLLTSNILTSITATFFMLTLAHAESTISYPSNYRQWTHIKSMIIQQGHPLFDSFGGIHHIYANNLALTGYQSGKFPEGSIIAFDLLEISEKNNAVIEKDRKVLGVMVKDSKQFAETSGWGFEGFGAGNANNHIVGNNYKQACYECHTSQQEKDYVFSEWRN